MKLSVFIRQKEHLRISSFVPETISWLLGGQLPKSAFG